MFYLVLCSSCLGQDSNTNIPIDKEYIFDKLNEKYQYRVYSSPNYEAFLSGKIMIDQSQFGEIKKVNCYPTFKVLF